MRREGPESSAVTQTPGIGPRESKSGESSGIGVLRKKIDGVK